MQARRDKNLCYNCDERYTRGHRCKLQFLLLTMVDTDDPPKELVELDFDSTINPPLEAGLISLHALSGQWNPCTFRVTRSINGYNVQILVDSGATHNFIQTRVAQFLQLPLEPTASPLQTNVVLGVHWLSLVSPIVMDYNGPFMRFMWQGKLVELQGHTGPSPSPISVHQLRRLQHTNRIVALFQLSLNTPTSPSSLSFNAFPLQPHQNTPSPLPPTSEPQLVALLHRYSTIFPTPTADILRKLERNLAKAQASMKKWADTNRKDIQFSVGDYVYVRLRPRRQASVVGPYISKLQKRFFGPVKITNKLGAVAYELELLPCARIHNVFHVSFLHPHKGPLPNSPLQLHPEIDKHQPILEPAAILDWKWDNSTSEPQIQVLILWLGLPLEEATWEPWQVIKSQFHLEDKVILESAGDVRITGPITLIPSNESTTGASSHMGRSLITYGPLH
ncbi:hypothetical protein V8G54_012257 [Vigna mungo]|uniref:Tf2-1-like SH3-like domain-containing protein n=1 Tax=Vigna mungo TaxID=3915 RepID=A0AAQ3NTF2_VIGMU